MQVLTLATNEAAASVVASGDPPSSGGAVVVTPPDLDVAVTILVHLALDLRGCPGRSHLRF